MTEMERVVETAGAMAWLADRFVEEGMTGFDPDGWATSTWILHAMYENPDLTGFGTHDDLAGRRRGAHHVPPMFIGDVNLDGVGTVTGTPLGFLVRPGRAWRRVRWAEYLARFPDFHPSRELPPCHRWFPHVSWPVAVQSPPEGSMDEDGFDALVDVLSAQSPAGGETPCYAYYGALAASDFDAMHLWSGTLRALPDLLDERGGPYGFTPTNIWAADRRFFVYTDYDLWATKVSGEPRLISALHADPRLECLDWAGPSAT